MYIPNLIFLNLLVNKRINGIYNISSDECISKYNFGIKLIKGLFKRIKIFQIILIKSILPIVLRICVYLIIK